MLRALISVRPLCTYKGFPCAFPLPVGCSYAIVATVTIVVLTIDVYCYLSLLRTVRALPAAFFIRTNIELQLGYCQLPQRLLISVVTQTADWSGLEAANLRRPTILHYDALKASSRDLRQVRP